MPRTFVPRIKGLNLLVDRKQTNEPYVVEGKNFIVDAEGPLSGLGRDLLSYKAIDSPSNVDAFKVSETLESFIFTNVGVFRFDTISTKLIPLYKFAVVIDSQFPWSFAAVGNRYYFARKDFGLLEYDITDDEWTKLTGGSIPDNIYACEESEGRLILLTNLFIAWSTIGDGQDFVASASTGAGAQALTKLGLSNPIPLGIKKVPDGFLAFASSGIIKAQAINAVIPFRVTVLSPQHAPLNPYCIAKDIFNSVIILTSAGLFETDGRVIKPWQPLMSEYLHLKVINKLDLTNNQNSPRLDLDFDNAWFAISISEQQSPYIYNKAFILDMHINEWGSLDTSFVRLSEFKLLPTVSVGHQYGVIDNEGSIYTFNSVNGVENIPTLENGLFYYKPWTEYETVKNDDVLYFRTNGNWNTIPTLNLEAASMYDVYAKKEEYLDPVSVVAVEKSAIAQAYTTFFDDFIGPDFSELNATNPKWVRHPVSDAYMLYHLNQLFMSDSGSTSVYVYNEPPHETSQKLRIQIELVATSFTQTFMGGCLRCHLTETTMYVFALSNETPTGRGFYISRIVNGVETMLAFYAKNINSSKVVIVATATTVGNQVDLTLDVEEFPEVSIKYSDVAENRILKANYSGVYASTGSGGLNDILIDFIYLNYLDGISFKTNTIFAAGVIEVATIQQVREYSDLNSSILVGPFRIPDDQDNDRYMDMTNIIIGMNDAAVGDTSDDWASIITYPFDVEEDWLTATGDEDWGFGVNTGVDYDLDIIPTLEAYTEIVDNAAAVELLNSEGVSRFYSCNSNGIYHLIRIAAEDSDKNYHLKTLDLDYIPGGLI